MCVNSMSVDTDDPELTTEQAQLVAELSDSEISEIDSALLSATSKQWRKVARIVGIVMPNLPNRVNGIPDIYYAQRVAALVADGKLVSQGNLKQMRYCEVKSP